MELLNCWFLGGHMKNSSASTGFPRSWKILEKIGVMESHGKVLEYENFPKVMEKSWNCFFSWLWQHSSSWLSCMLWDTIITISETMWEWESWKKSKSVMEKSWNSVFWFLWEPCSICSQSWPFWSCRHIACCNSNTSSCASLLPLASGGALPDQCHKIILQAA